MATEKQQSDDAILTAVEAAQFLRVGKDTIYALVREGQIPFRRVGKQVRFPMWLLRSWMERRA